MADQQSGSGGGQGPGGGFIGGGKGRRRGNRVGAGAGGVWVCPRCGDAARLNGSSGAASVHSPDTNDNRSRQSG